MAKVYIRSENSVFKSAADNKSGCFCNALLDSCKCKFAKNIITVLEERERVCVYVCVREREREGEN